MTSLQRDPRKQYVLNKRHCEELSITQKLYHPECMKEVSKSISVNPKPKQPKNIPSLGPVPNVPYSFQPAGNFDYSPDGGGYDPTLLAAGVVATAAAVGGTGYLIRRGLQLKGYRRVRTVDPEEGTELDNLRAPRADGYERVPTTTEEGTELTEFGGRSSEVERPSESGLRRRLPRPVEEAPMEDVPLTEQPTLVQSRLPRPGEPVELESMPTQASATELAEAEARAAQLRSDLDEIMQEARAQQAGITEAEAQVETLQSEATATEAISGAETMEAEAQATARLESMEEGVFGAEGLEAEAEAGVEAAVETGVEAAGVEAGEVGGFSAMEAGVMETAAGEEGVGLGPEDIPMDVIAGATVVIGTIGVGIASLFGAGKKSPPKYKNISGTAVMSGKDVDKALSSINSKLSTEQKGTPKYNSLLSLSNALTTAKTNKTDVISFKNAQGKPDISVPLSNAQLATAIKVYQKNPNAYKGMDKTKLEVMGLSPIMAEGETGATQTSIGFIPKTSPDGTPFSTGSRGGNWTNFYTAKYNDGVFRSNDSINTLAVPDSKQKKQMDDNYIARATTIINNETDPEVKNYLNYELNMFKYNNGYISDKPAPVPKPTLGTAQQAKMTQLTDTLNNRRRHLIAIQNSIDNKKSIIEGINTQINNINAQDQERAKTVYKEQLESYRTQANAYNQQLAQNIEATEQKTATTNIMFARATNTVLNAPTGRYLTQGQIQSFHQQLASGQIKTTGVNPIVSLTRPVVTTRANGSPVVNQNSLNTVAGTVPVKS